MRGAAITKKRVSAIEWLADAWINAEKSQVPLGAYERTHVLTRMCADVAHVCACVAHSSQKEFQHLVDELFVWMQLTVRDGTTRRWFGALALPVQEDIFFKNNINTNIYSSTERVCRSRLLISAMGNIANGFSVWHTRYSACELLDVIQLLYNCQNQTIH